jgi:hypothetical protein
MSRAPGESFLAYAQGAPSGLEGLPILHSTGSAATGPDQDSGFAPSILALAVRFNTQTDS